MCPAPAALHVPSQVTPTSLLLTITQSPALGMLPTSAHAAAAPAGTGDAEETHTFATFSARTAGLGADAASSPHPAPSYSDCAAQPCALCEAWFQGFIVEAAAQLFGMQVQVAAVHADSAAVADPPMRLPDFMQHAMNAAGGTSAAAATTAGSSQNNRQHPTTAGSELLACCRVPSLGSNPQGMSVFEGAGASVALCAKPAAIRLRVVGAQLWGQGRDPSPTPLTSGTVGGAAAGHAWQATAAAGAKGPAVSGAAVHRTGAGDDNIAEVCEVTPLAGATATASAATAATTSVPPAVVLPLEVLDREFPLHLLLDAEGLRVVQVSERMRFSLASFGRRSGQRVHSSTASNAWERDAYSPHTTSRKAGQDQGLQGSKLQGLLVR